MHLERELAVGNDDCSVGVDRDQVARVEEHHPLAGGGDVDCRSALREDTLIRDTLGDSIYEGFLEAKSIEWTEYRKQVHAWELERYLPVF